MWEQGYTDVGTRLCRCGNEAVGMRLHTCGNEAMYMWESGAVHVGIYRVGLSTSHGSSLPQTFGEVPVGIQSGDLIDLLTVQLPPQLAS